MIQKSTILKFILATGILFYSCNAGEKKELTSLTGLETPKLTFPTPEPKDTLIFIPPLIEPDEDDYPYDPPCGYPVPTIVEEPDTIPPKPYTMVEIMPQFDGGTDAVLKYIRENLKYPQTDSDVQGRVVLRFTVTKEGDIEDVIVLRSLAYEFDREAVRVIKSMPKWIPGKQNGKNVDVYYNVPVAFRLTSE